MTISDLPDNAILCLTPGDIAEIRAELRMTIGEISKQIRLMAEERGIYAEFILSTALLGVLGMNTGNVLMVRKPTESDSVGELVPVSSIFLENWSAKHAE